MSTVALLSSHAFSEPAVIVAQKRDLGYADNNGRSPKPAAGSENRPGGVLRVETVLRSVDKTHPQIEVALQKVKEAKGKQQAARGGFDPTLHVDGKIQPVGFYESNVVDTLMRQPTPLWGMELFGGWRYGRGNIADYNGGLETETAGELRAGIDLPIWRDGLTDRRRTDIRLAELAEKIAGLEQTSKRIELYRGARRAYYEWVRTGRVLFIQEGLLDIAVQRQAQIEALVAGGALPAIDAIDNERALLRRKDLVLESIAKFRGAAFSLSLFYRDRKGEPVRPGRGALPSTLPAANMPADARKVWLKQAYRERPELQAIRLDRTSAEAELRLAKNQLAPDVRVQAMVAKDLGEEEAELDPFEFSVGFKAKWPLPLRKERGTRSAAKARLRGVDARVRALRDAIGAQVRDAWNSLAVAKQRYEVSDRQLQLAGQVSAAERARFEEGTGNLLNVNIREIAEAETARVRLSALAEFHMSYADLLAAAGRLR